MTDEIDYEALFNQVRVENEGLRINIIKLKNDEISLLDCIKDKLADIMDSPYAGLYIYAAFMVLVFVLEPLIRALISYIFRRKTDEK